MMISLLNTLTNSTLSYFCVVTVKHASIRKISMKTFCFPLYSWCFQNLCLRLNGNTLSVRNFFPHVAVTQEKASNVANRISPLFSANEVSERIVSASVGANLIIYLTAKYHLSTASSAIIIFVYIAAANFLPVCGAIVSDALLGRFLMVTLTLFSCTIVRALNDPLVLTELKVISFLNWVVLLLATVTLTWITYYIYV